MKEGEIIYIMYNHPECAVQTELLLSGRNKGRENWKRRNNRVDHTNPAPKHITIWINKDQFITSSFILGFLEEFGIGKTHQQLFNSVNIKVTGSYAQEDLPWINELQQTVSGELRRALVRLATMNTTNN